jgi:acetyl-CoA C-acetyltransferase
MKGAVIVSTARTPIGCAYKRTFNIRRIAGKNGEADSFVSERLTQDEGNRPGTTLESLSQLKPVVEGGTITAGNASQLSDGASACVLMDGSLAARRGLQPLGLFEVLA